MMLQTASAPNAIATKSLFLNIVVLPSLIGCRLAEIARPTVITLGLGVPGIVAARHRKTVNYEQSSPWPEGESTSGGQSRDPAYQRNFVLPGFLFRLFRAVAFTRSR